MTMTKDQARLLGAAAAGAALGAFVGLLVAPASGRRTRRHISHAIGDGRDAVVRTSNRASSGVSDYLLGQFERSKRALAEAASR
jgi:gas vesicle protein